MKKILALFKHSGMFYILVFLLLLSIGAVVISRLGVISADSIYSFPASIKNGEWKLGLTFDNKGVDKYSATAYYAKKTDDEACAISAHPVVKTNASEEEYTKMSVDSKYNQIMFDIKSGDQLSIQRIGGYDTIVHNYNPAQNTKTDIFYYFQKDKPVNNAGGVASEIWFNVYCNYTSDYDAVYDEFIQILNDRLIGDPKAISDTLISYLQQNSTPIPENTVNSGTPSPTATPTKASGENVSLSKTSPTHTTTPEVTEQENTKNNDLVEKKSNEAISTTTSLLPSLSPHTSRIFRYIGISLGIFILLVTVLHIYVKYFSKYKDIQ